MHTISCWVAFIVLRHLNYLYISNINLGVDLCDMFCSNCLVSFFRAKGASSTCIVLLVMILDRAGVPCQRKPDPQSVWFCLILELGFLVFFLTGLIFEVPNPADGKNCLHFPIFDWKTQMLY